MKRILLAACMVLTVALSPAAATAPSISNWSGSWDISGNQGPDTQTEDFGCMRLEQRGHLFVGQYSGTDSVLGGNLRGSISADGLHVVGRWEDVDRNGNSFAVGDFEWFPDSSGQRFHGSWIADQSRNIVRRWNGTRHKGQSCAPDTPIYMS